MMPRIRDLIHDIDPYDGLMLDSYTPDLQGWGSTHPVFRYLIEDIRPRLILEVGTWKGASALHMAQIQRSLNIEDAEICCVDTWLGALEFWLGSHRDLERYQSLKLQNGFPSVYYTFLRNVLFKGADRLITPFPTTSAIAARFFAYHGIKFDLIYIDGSHDYEDVRDDLSVYWSLTAPNGALLGDDYGNKDWPGVERAVDEFAIALGKRPEFITEKWFFRK
jgi:SAM-dependent methyltransferase